MTDADLIKLAAAFGADKALEKAKSAEDWAGKLIAMAEHRALASLFVEINELQSNRQVKQKEESP